MKKADIHRPALKTCHYVADDLGGDSTVIRHRAMTWLSAANPSLITGGEDDGSVDQSALIRPGYAHYRQMRLAASEDQLHKMAGGQMQSLVAL